MHILVNDFIGGVLDRGIPLYVRNLIYGLREEGLRVSVVRAPAVFRRLPRGLFYIVAVMVEQLALPAIGFVLRADVTIYPYNSIAVIDVLTRRGRIVVHDLEQLAKPRLAPARLYCAACYAVLRRFAYPIFTIAEIIREKIAASGVFGRAAIRLLPNTFYLFENLVRAAAPQPPRENSILLCTGSTPNKDFSSLVAGYIPPLLAQGFSVSILGLHKKDDAALLAPLQSALASGQLRLCGQLTDPEVVHEYLSHRIVWVHSLREGFGRCVVEGRLAGRPVLCSAIAEFLTLRDAGVHFYANAAEFTDCVGGLVQPTERRPEYSGYPYRQMLHAAVAEGL